MKKSNYNIVRGGSWFETKKFYYCCMTRGKALLGIQDGDISFRIIMKDK